MANLKVSSDIDLLLQSTDFAAAQVLLGIATNSANITTLNATTPHNTDNVIICNNGDNIQDKLNEAALLPSSNRTLLVMSGNYGDVELTDDNITSNVSIIGIGNVKIGSFEDNAALYSTFGTYKNFTCDSFSMNIPEANIENITTTGSFSVYWLTIRAKIKDIKCGTSFDIIKNDGIIKDIKCGTYFKSDTDGNYGTIKNVNAETVFVDNNLGTVDNVNSTNDWVHLANTGTIKNCSGNPFLEDQYNDGIIDNCHSTGTAIKAFGGQLGSFNKGTIKNCTSTGNESFGQQYATGVTENCTGGDKAFAATSGQIDFGNGLGVQGTYRNCRAGNNSFFGQNVSTNGAKIIEANYYNCTAEVNSFGFVNFAGAETHFAGEAIGCIGGINTFSTANNGAAKILNGAVIENCIGGYNSFAGINGVNEGAILRCRTLNTGTAAFKATGTGKVRLCLDGNYNEVNLG